MPDPAPPSHAFASSRRGAVLVGLMVLAGCGEGTQASGKGQEEREEITPLVRIAVLEEREVQREIGTTAYLESEHRVPVYPRVGGRVDDVSVDEGDLVTRGDLLAQIDDREARSALEQLKVSLETAKITKELAELEVDASARRVTKAKIDTRQAQAEFDRKNNMNQEIVAPKDREDAEFALEAVKEAEQLAVFDARKAKLDVKQKDRAIEELNARIREARVRLEDHKITAPIDGVVSTRQIKGGETITAGTELFVVLDPDNLVAYLSRPQSELPVIRGAKEVVFQTDALPGRSFTAAVDLVSRTVERETGSFTLRIRVQKDQKDIEQLLPGMFLRARILAEARRQALMVPKAAILNEGNTAVLFTVRDGRAVRVNVDPGLELDAWVETRNLGNQGLKAGDVVVVSGQEELEDQDKVELAPQSRGDVSTPGAGSDRDSEAEAAEPASSSTPAADQAAGGPRDNPAPRKQR